MIVRARAIVQNENKKETGWVEKGKTEESFVKRLHASWNLVVRLLFHVLGALSEEYKWGTDLCKCEREVVEIIMKARMAE